MGADVSKSVEIAFKITGGDSTKGLKTITDSLTKLKTAVDDTVTKISSISTELGKIKAPASLTTLINDLKQISKIKAPNLDQLANGFKKLAAIKDAKDIPNLGPFATQLKKIAKVGNLPNLGQIASGFKKIMDTKFTGFQTKIKTLETGLKRLGAVNLDALAAVLKNLNKIDLNKVTGNLKRVEAAVKKTGNSAKTSSRSVRSFADAFRTVAQFRVVASVLHSISQAFREGATAIIEYDQALKDLQAITGASTNEVAQMGAKILEVASTTKFSASEIAEGMRIIGQAGFSAGESIQLMQSVSDLATGTLSTMASTVDLVTTTMRVLNVETSNSQSVVDTFANAVNKSKLTVDKLRTAMNYVGPIAKTAGVSFQELSAAMGTLANSGLRASTIGTGLRRVFAELVSPSQKMTDAAKKAGIALNELSPTSNNLTSVLGNLRLVLSDAGTAFEIFGKRGAAAALALVDNDAGFATMLDTVSRSGTAANMAATQMEGLGVSFKNLKDRLGVLAISLGEAGISGTMRILIDVSKKLVIVLTALAGTTFGKMIVGLGLLSTAIIAVSVAMSVMQTAFNFVAATAGIKMLVAKWASMALFFETSMSGLAGMVLFNPTTLGILAGIAVAIAAVGAAYNKIMGNTSELVAENAKLATEYDNLSSVILNYQMKIIGLGKESKELKDANLTLRDSLLVTKNEFNLSSTFSSDVSLLLIINIARKVM